MEPIVTDYVNLTEEEFIRFSLHAHRKRVGRMKLIGTLGCVLFLAGMVLAVQLVVFTGLVLAGTGFGDVVYLRSWFKKRYLDPKNLNLRSPTRAVIDDVQVSFESQSGTRSSIPWANFIDIEEFDGNILLYIAKETPAVMLPRAQSEGDWARFKALSETKRIQLAG